MITLPEQIIMGRAWVRIECDGVLWDVAPDYVHCVGIAEAELHAKAAGCELPTPRLSDRIYQLCDLKLRPLLRSERGADMSSAAASLDQARRIEAQIAGREYRLLGGTHKDVVRTTTGELAIYGWHVEDGEEWTATPLHPAATPDLGAKVIQPVYTRHLLSWRDPSQGARLCRRLG